MWKLDQHPHVAVEKPEKLLQVQRFALRSKGFQPHASLPTWSTKAEKWSPRHMWLWKSAGILTTGDRQESARNPGALLQGQYTQSHLWALTLGPSRGMAALKWQVTQGQTGLCGFGKRARVPLLSLYWDTLPHHPRTPFSWVKHSPPYGINQPGKI